MKIETEKPFQNVYSKIFLYLFFKIELFIYDISYKFAHIHFVYNCECKKEADNIAILLSHTIVVSSSFQRDSRKSWRLKNLNKKRARAGVAFAIPSLFSL